jgi:diadenosine tetraphosphate (Ap4A) HIT family hydrolase
VETVLLESGCETCRLIDERNQGNAPLWDCVLRTDFFDVVHAYGTSLPGWMVLVVNRHIAAIDEMTEAESLELGKLIREVSLALKEILGCEKTYVMQFAEAPGHGHVHFHVVPRAAGMPDQNRGIDVFNYMKQGPEVAEVEKNDIARQIRAYLLS